MNKYLEKINDTIKRNKENIIKPTVTLFIICLAVTLALSVTNMFTEKKISDLQIKAQESSMKKLLKGDEYQKDTLKLNDENTEYYAVIKGGKTVGYIFTTSKYGYGGDISVMTAVSTDGKIIGVDILDASGETAGLGQNVTKEGFYSQFKDKSGNISVVKNSAENNEINAVTGATISSKAVTAAVNEALEIAEQISKEESK